MPGNTPLVRVPLLDRTGDSRRSRRRKPPTSGGGRSSRRSSPDGVDRAYSAFVKLLIREQTAQVSRCGLPSVAGPVGKTPVGAMAKQHELHEGLLAGWVDYLGRIEKQTWIPTTAGIARCRDRQAGRRRARSIGRSELQAVARGRVAEANRRRSDRKARARSAHSAVRLRADDPDLLTDATAASRSGRIESGFSPTRGHAAASRSRPDEDERDDQRPCQAGAPVRRPGPAGSPRTVPPTGSLFVVFRTADTAGAAQRLLGWEDSDVGKHGLA